jgi:hypothetical protein
VPRLVLGDVFAKASDECVYVVLNAGCDLQFSPINPDRHADPKLPIYLMPGRLEPLGRSTSDPVAKRTELFEWGGATYRILWDAGHVFSVNLEEVQKWCEGKGYHRVARIGSVYALAMQQLWTSSLGRVGLMVTPPLTESADFQIYRRNGVARLEAYGARVKGQVILGTRRLNNADVDWFCLTTEGVEQLLPALRDLPGHFDSLAQAIPEGPHKAGKVRDFRRWSASALAFAGLLDPWLGLLEREHTLAREDGNKLKPDDATTIPITFSWQACPSGKVLSDFGGPNVLLVVDILRPETPQQPTQLAGCQPSEGSLVAGQPSAEAGGDKEGTADGGLAEEKQPEVSGKV